MFKFIVAAILLMSSQVMASPSKGSYTVSIDHPLEIYQGGSIEEALSLSKEWRDKVLLKNPHMLSVDYLLEKQSDTRYLLLVLYNYKDKESAGKANQLLGDLIAKAWPNEEERNQFFKKLSSYVVQDEKTTHKFEVLD